MQTRVLTVSQLNNYAEKLLNNDPILNAVSVKGEISNLKSHSSGHSYFSIKDMNCRINCVLFRSYAAQVKTSLQNGQNVVVNGNVSLYAATGQYQLYAKSIQNDGLGELFIRYQKLKEQLENEGLFDQQRKRPIVVVPKKVAVVTSATGAAVRDIIHVIRRRNPNVKVVIIPCQVQGMLAGQQIAKAITLANQYSEADTIIVGRGGGSIEELWAFNEEVVARAIATSAIPVISAVGHETDFTIADFIADLRAPTPSAAAELCTLDIVSEKQLISKRINALNGLVQRMLTEAKNRYTLIKRLDTYRSEDQRFASYKKRIGDARIALDNGMETYYQQTKMKLTTQLALVEKMNPLSAYTRGFASVHHMNGQQIMMLDDVNIKDTVVVRFKAGELNCEVLSKENGV
jgi:exodeoxyribonuclease VII large subunit